MAQAQNSVGFTIADKLMNIICLHATQLLVDWHLTVFQQNIVGLEHKGFACNVSAAHN